MVDPHLRLSMTQRGSRVQGKNRDPETLGVEVKGNRLSLNDPAMSFSYQVRHRGHPKL